MARRPVRAMFHWRVLSNFLFELLCLLRFLNRFHPCILEGRSHKLSLERFLWDFFKRATTWLFMPFKTFELLSSLHSWGERVVKGLIGKIFLRFFKQAITLSFMHLKIFKPCLLSHSWGRMIAKGLIEKVLLRPFKWVTFNPLFI